MKRKVNAWPWLVLLGFMNFGFCSGGSEEFEKLSDCLKKHDKCYENPIYACTSMFCGYGYHDENGYHPPPDCNSCSGGGYYGCLPYAESKIIDITEVSDEEKG